MSLENYTKKSHMLSKYLVRMFFSVFLLTLFAPSQAMAQYYSVVDAHVPANGCTNAWPSEILGTYSENGTNDSRPAYEGPNGYWLYHAPMGSGVGAAWVVGYPKGNTNINSATVRHYLSSTANTPPLNTNFTYSPNGCGTIKVQTGSAPPPAAPTLTSPYSGTVHTTSIDLYWNQVSGATNYRIDVSTSSSFSSFVSPYDDFATPTGTPYPPTSYTVTGLSQGTTYYIRVRTENGGGQSSSSNTVSATTIPSAPTSIAATPIDDQSFQANWNAQPGATSYLLYVSASSSFSSHMSGYNGTSVSATSKVVTGLSDGTTYYYRIKASNTYGTSGYSNATSTLTGPPVPVSSPATGIGASGFTANWGVSSGAIRYGLDVSTSNGFGSFVSGYNDLDVGNVTSKSITGLNAGTTYYYRVRAYNATSPSGNSATQSALLIPPAPVTTTASSIQQDSFTANWNTATGTTGYRLDVSENSGFSTFVAGYNNLDAGPSTSQSITGLSAYTTYYYRVRAVNASGTSSNSNTTSVQTQGQPAAVTTNSVTNVTGNSATGNATITDLGLPTATEHGMAWNTIGSPTVAEGVSTEGIPSATGDYSSAMTGLLPGTMYYARAYATNDIGPAYGVSDVSFTTLAPTLSITLSPGTTAGTCGGNNTWTIAVTNTGPVNADVVLVEVTPGAWLDVNLTTSTAGLTDLGGGVYGWEFNNLASSGSHQLTLVTTLNPDGLPNQASCIAALRTVNVRTTWGAGTTGDAVDSNPTTRNYDKLYSTWASSTPSTVEMPNLVATGITADKTCSGDSNLTGTITVTIQNTGTSDAAGPFTVQVTDGKGWTGTGVYSGTLSAGGTDTVSINTATWSVACHACGDPYSLNASVDLNNDVCECNETDNEYGPVSYSVELPDLAIQNDTLALSCLADGQVQVSGNLGIINTGCGTFSDDLPVRFTLYDNTGCTGNILDQWTETLSVTCGADGGTATASISSHTWQPTVSSPGTNCQTSIHVELDYNDSICECDGTNNSFCADNKTIDIPDLLVQSDALSVTVPSDDTLAVSGTITVANDGCGTNMTNDIDVRFTLYSQGDGTGTVLHQWTQTFTGINIVAEGGTQVLTLTGKNVALTDGIPGNSCDVSIQAELDYTHALCETLASNNVFLTSPINLNAPDIKVTAQALEIMCNSGGPDTIHGTITLANMGCSSVTGDVTVALAMRDQPGCIGNLEHQWTETFHGLNIAPMGSVVVPISTESAELSICSSLNPEASVWIEADSTHTIAELNGNNNGLCGDIILKHLIESTAGANGQIDPVGTIPVIHGQDQVFRFIPDTGFHVDHVIIDGEQLDGKSAYTFHNVIEDHTIHVDFVANIPPVIDRFTRDPDTGDAPLIVNFLVDAHDPDGGRIVRYDWQIEGRRTESRSTYTGDMTYRFTLPGDWSITVTVTDDEGETATSTQMHLTTTQSGPVTFPIPTSQDAAKMNLPDANLTTWVLNPFESATEVRPFLVDTGGVSTELLPVTVAGFGKQSLSTNSKTEIPSGSSLMVEADRHMMYVTRFSSALADMAAPLTDALESELFVPHIAEEIDQWDTSLYLSTGSSNPNLFGKVTVGNVSTTIELPPSQTLDIESYLPTPPQTDSSWGTITASGRDPFSNTHVLSGLELFIREGGDGAAVEVGQQLYRTLYIPHIPTETDQFWTGFALINPNEETSNAHVRLFNDQGETAGAYDLVIPPHFKVKGLLGDLFPGSVGTASWGIISADLPISGLEIYGTEEGGICGFALSGIQHTEATLPLLAVDTEHWTGVALTNAGTKDANVMMQLMASDGTVRLRHTLVIAAGTRQALLLTDLFPDLDVQATDHIRIVSDQAISALEVSGDMINSTLLAIPAMD